MHSAKSNATEVVKATAHHVSTQRHRYVLRMQLLKDGMRFLRAPYPEGGRGHLEMLKACRCQVEPGTWAQRMRVRQVFFRCQQRTCGLGLRA